MNNVQIVLKQEQKQVTLLEKYEQVVLRDNTPQIIIRGGPIVANILSFSVRAAQSGQTQFALYDTQGNAIYYSQIICLFVMGTGQDILAGDYTFNGNIITLGPSAPVIAAGDLVFGAGMT